VVRPSKYTGKRAGKGSVVLRRGGFVEWEQVPWVSLLAREVAAEEAADEAADEALEAALEEKAANEGENPAPKSPSENGVRPRAIPIVYIDEDGES
jgi:hypothetical protein